MVDESIVGERLAKIETRLDSMDSAWRAHTQQDKEHYEEISKKVNQLLRDKAVRTGEERGVKRMVGTISVIVSGIVSGVAIFLKQFFGGG